MLRSLALWWKAFLDPRTPAAAKLFVALGLFYGISPLDVIPDMIPLLGQADDLTVIVAVILYFLRATKAIRADLQKRGAVETTAREVRRSA